jgi:thiamine-phosphate pyrophosphorylase
VPLALTLVTDRRRLPPGRGLAAVAADAAAAGLDRVQLREKDLNDRALLASATAMAAALAGSSTALAVNGRPDVAALAGAAGVQLPSDGLRVASVRRAFPALDVGASCHSIDDARRAEQEGADWIVYGPVLATPGKESRAVGFDALAAVVAAVRVPVHAVGGLGPEHAARVAAAGAAGILAIRAFLDRPVAAAAAAFRGAR